MARGAGDRTREDIDVEAALAILDQRATGIQLPPAPEGWEYAIATTHVMGEPDNASMIRTRAAQWEPLPKSDHPEWPWDVYSGQVQPGVEQKDDGYFRPYNSLIAVKRRSVFGEAERMRQARQAGEAMKVVDRLSASDAEQFRSQGIEFDQPQRTATVLRGSRRAKLQPADVSVG